MYNIKFDNMNEAIIYNVMENGNGKQVVTFYNTNDAFKYINDRFFTHDLICVIEVIEPSEAVQELIAEYKRFL